MKSPSDKAKDQLTQMLVDCSDGWLEAVDTALAWGHSFEVVLKATQHWLAGAYERADLLLQGEDIRYTIVTEVGRKSRERRSAFPTLMVVLTMEKVI